MQDRPQKNQSQSNKTTNQRGEKSGRKWVAKHWESSVTWTNAADTNKDGRRVPPVTQTEAEAVAGYRRSILTHPVEKHQQTLRRLGSVS